jgi:hypothetical protein
VFVYQIGELYLSMPPHKHSPHNFHDFVLSH